MESTSRSSSFAPFLPPFREPSEFRLERRVPIIPTVPQTNQDEIDYAPEETSSQRKKRKSEQLEEQEDSQSKNLVIFNWKACPQG